MTNASIVAVFSKEEFEEILEDGIIEDWPRVVLVPFGKGSELEGEFVLMLSAEYRSKPLPWNLSSMSMVFVPKYSLEGYHAMDYLPIFEYESDSLACELERFTRILEDKGEIKGIHIIREGK